MERQPRIKDLRPIPGANMREPFAPPHLRTSERHRPERPQQEPIVIFEAPLVLESLRI